MSKKEGKWAKMNRNVQKEKKITKISRNEQNGSKKEQKGAEMSNKERQGTNGKKLPGCDWQKYPDKTSKLVLTICLPDKTSKAGWSKFLRQS